MYKITFILLVSILLIGCGPSFKDGKVIEKKFQPAYTYEEIIPIYHYDENGAISFVTFVPHTNYVPDRYGIHLRDIRSHKTEWFIISKELYNTIKKDTVIQTKHLMD